MGLFLFFVGATIVFVWLVARICDRVFSKILGDDFCAEEIVELYESRLFWPWVIAISSLVAAILIRLFK